MNREGKKIILKHPGNGSAPLHTCTDEQFEHIVYSSFKSSTSNVKVASGGIVSFSQGKLWYSFPNF